MNRRHLFQLIGGAFAAAALDLGMVKPVVADLNSSFTDAGWQYVEVRMPRYDWIKGVGWVETTFLNQRFGDSIAQEPNPGYVDSDDPNEHDSR